MVYKKGESGNPDGMKKGTKWRKTAEWEKLGNFITDPGAKRAARIMAEADDETFMRYYEKFLEYFKPRQQRKEITGEVETVIKIIEGRAEQIKHDKNSTGTDLPDEEAERGTSNTEG